MKQIQDFSKSETKDGKEILTVQAPKQGTEFKPASEIQPASEVKALSKPFEVSEVLGIPKEFIIVMEGNHYVKRAGLLFKAEKKGIRAIQAIPMGEEGGKVVYEGRVYPPITAEEVEIIKTLPHIKDPKIQEMIASKVLQPYIDYGSASDDSIRMKTLLPFKHELASTRATNRALRLYVACGWMSIEETPEAEAVEK